MTRSIFARRRFVFSFVVLSAALAWGSVDRAAFAQEQGAPLKSAEELAQLLRARLDVAIEPPRELTYDVLTAEQRTTRAIVFKSGADWNDPNSIVWEWDPAKAPELPKGYAGKFSNISECKPSSDRKSVLIAASGGAAAIVRVADKKTIFYGTLRERFCNPHSIELLPDGNVAAVASGGILVLFATSFTSTEDAPAATEKTPVAKTFELPSAHGVVWDGKRSILWALGNDLVGYRCVGTKEKPDLEEIFRTPFENGHDLWPANGYDALMLTGLRVAVFDPEARRILPVCDMKRVKSVSVDDRGNVLTQRPVEEWWSEALVSGDRDDTVIGKYDGARFYKARWFAPNEFWKP